MVLSSIMLSTACAPSQQGELKFELYAGGFTKPVGLYSALDGSGRLFVLEQNGIIRIVVGGSTIKTPFLDISDIVSKGSEQGLLGLAFHPNYKKNGYFFINYTDKDGSTIVARYSVSKHENIADKKSAKLIMRIKQPFSNNNGGALAFGPDGYLYIATGDGGGKGDPHNNARSIQKYLGKILRIDVDHGKPYSIPDGNPFKYIRMANVVREIWLFGFRNPWRMSFDAETGDLFIGDIGQDSFEEIDYFKYKSSAGKNYGWNTLEASHCYPPGSECILRYFEAPILEYSHKSGLGFSVTGGYVYRGNNKELYGSYVFGDFVSGNIWKAVKQNGKWKMELLRNTDFKISSFGRDENQELYVVDYAGSIYKLH